MNPPTITCNNWSSWTVFCLTVSMQLLLLEMLKVFGQLMLWSCMALYLNLAWNIVPNRPGLAGTLMILWLLDGVTGPDVLQQQSQPCLILVLRVAIPFIQLLCQHSSFVKGLAM